MNKKNLKNLSKFLTICLASLIIALSLGQVITTFQGYHFRDVIFVEGMLILMVGVFSSIGGNPMSLSLQGFGYVNAQYLANVNLEINEIDRKRINDSGIVILSMDLSSISFMLGGIISIAISFLL